MTTCDCGCGETPPLAPRTDAAKGWVRAQPRPRLPGHYRRPRVADPDFTRPSGRADDAAWGDERLPDRFWEKVYPEPNTGCWLWGAADTRGHGVFWLSLLKELHYAHRVAWRALVAPIPDGLEIDHLCRQRCCVRPDHLDVVTHRINVTRGDARWNYLAYRDDRCRQGHAFTPDNTRVPAGTDQRVCVMCKRDGGRRRVSA